MRTIPASRRSPMATSLVVVFALAIGSTVMGAEDSGALAMRDPRPAAGLPAAAPADLPRATASATVQRVPPDAQSASLRFWRNGGLPDASTRDESLPVTVVVADTRSPSRHDGIARATAIWRDGGER